MFRILFVFIVAIHGFIHLMGFIKAFKLTEINQLAQDISKPTGLL
jgi:ssRNA-specific RNase YbeY (16S rRNA maturation enzyme)